MQPLKALEATKLRENTSKGFFCRKDHMLEKAFARTEDALPARAQEVDSQSKLFGHHPGNGQTHQLSSHCNSIEKAQSNTHLCDGTLWQKGDWNMSDASSSAATLEDGSVFSKSMAMFCLPRNTKKTRNTQKKNPEMPVFKRCCFPSPVRLWV
jgi:hypothetical protein